MANIQSDNLPSKTRFQGTDQIWGWDTGGTSYKLSGVSVKGFHIVPISGTTHTLELSNEFGYLRINSATDHTLTVPTNSSVAFSIGAWIDIRQVANGNVILTGASGVTLNIPTGYSANSKATGSVIRLLKVGEDEWDVSGDLEAS